MCRTMVSSAPMGNFNGDTFERLTQSLVSPAVTVTKVAYVTQTRIKWPRCAEANYLNEAP